VVNKLTRPATREEKIVNPGVYEIVQRAEEVFESAKKRQWVGLTDEEIEIAFDAYETERKALAGITEQKGN
jgi:hypothetical protein